MVSNPVLHLLVIFAASLGRRLSIIAESVSSAVQGLAGVLPGRRRLLAPDLFEAVGQLAYIFAQSIEILAQCLEIVCWCLAHVTAPYALLSVETLKNAIRGIFQLASARYTPAPGSVNQALRARFTLGHPTPDGEAPDKALPYATIFTESMGRRNFVRLRRLPRAASPWRMPWTATACDTVQLRLRKRKCLPWHFSARHGAVHARAGLRESSTACSIHAGASCPGREAPNK
jgi:hypothetical protein